MTLNEFLEKTFDSTAMFCIRPRLICKDGFSMSVQGNQGAYCSPREALASGYTDLEVGYPSEDEVLLKEFAEDPDNLTDTIYGYVHVKVIEEVITKHGGIIGRGF